MNWIYKIEDAVEFIEKNLTEEISVASVGDAIHYSSSMLSIIFSAVTGYSIGEYIRYRRLSCALDDIENKELTITEISQKYNYDTVEAFSKAFKRLFGISPSKYNAFRHRLIKFEPIKLNFRIHGGFNMDRNVTKEFLEKQYSNSSKLQTRINFHQKCSTNKTLFSEWLFENYEFKKGTKILELGSGSGNLWNDKIDDLPRNLHITLSDYSKGMVKELQDKFHYLNVTIKRIDIQDIPYDDDSFDIIIANHMLYHVPNIDKAISEVARVLKKGGMFYSATNSINNMRSFFDKTLNEFDGSIKVLEPLSFLLENGKDYLEKQFNIVTIKEYINKIKIKDTNDLLDYLYSSSLIANIESYKREDLYNYYDSLKDENGVINIFNKGGTFISKR